MRRRGSEGNHKEDRIWRDKALRERKLRSIYAKLRKRFGFRSWWPGDTDFEVLVGAILTQQTTWSNVEKAIASLKREDALDLDSIADVRIDKLERLIRSSGFYKQKARRLRGVCRAIRRGFGSLDSLFDREMNELRELLLSYNGIGNETADSIVLYAAEKPTFVIDAYTMRIMGRIDSSLQSMDYMAMKGYFEYALNPHLELYKDFHAQFVELGKRYCKTKPLCDQCPLSNICSYRKAKILYHGDKSIRSE